MVGLQSSECLEAERLWKKGEWGDWLEVCRCLLLSQNQPNVFGPVRLRDLCEYHYFDRVRISPDAVEYEEQRMSVGRDLGSLS